MRKTALGLGMMLGLSGTAFAQAPCYSAAQCAQIRQQYEQQVAAQRDAQNAAIAERTRLEHDQHLQMEARQREATKEQARQTIEQQRQRAQAQADAEIRAAEATKERARVAAEQQAAYENQQRQQAQYRADAEVRAQEVAMARAQQKAEQQEAYEQQKRLAAAALENRAAAQMAAENSPDNRCHDQKTAGDLLTFFNGLQAVSDFNSRAVDIDHLTTLKFDPDHRVMSCHGSFLLQDGRQSTGILSTRLNVAGAILTTFHADAD
jgi:hypothetical protein